MAALSFIPSHYTTEFSTNWMLLVQQKTNKLKEYVTVDTVNGAEKVYNQMDVASMRLITTRAQVTTPQDIASAKRWLREKGYDAVALFDEFDEKLLGSVVLPTSATIESHAAAYQRTAEQVIIDAVSGTSYTGVDGTTAVTLPSTQSIAVNLGGGANTGMTVAKLIKARSILAKNEVDLDDAPVLALSQQQIDDLLTTTQVTSADYASVKALVEGKIDYFMGFKIKQTERLPLDSTTDIRSCFAWAKSGVVLGDGGKRVHMDIRPDLSHALQIRTVARLGATRTEEKKVVRIYCDESP
jgi:hypothetical protein